MSTPTCSATSPGWRTFLRERPPLLCRFHHTAVHEGRVRIGCGDEPGPLGANRWQGPSRPPRWAGAPFDLHDCVQVLFRMKIPSKDQDQQAA
jgi:hypothetical protein